MDLYGVKASSWCIYKSLELREEQANVAGFSVRSNCYYDIDAYRPMMGMGTWVSYCNVAVIEINKDENKMDAKPENRLNRNTKMNESDESSDVEPVSVSDVVVTYKYHTIRSGDTLGRIARKYNTTVFQICQLNEIKPNTVLRVGQILMID